MGSPADRVTVWQSQLAANDFPPVCAMCGQPAEMWRKFTFSTAPPWAYFLGAIMVMALARRASGYLPMTRACVQRISRVRWLFGAVLLSALGFWSAAIIVGAFLVGDSTWSRIAPLLFLLGMFAAGSGLVGLVVARRSYGPSGKVGEQRYGQYEPVIELQRVHPNFVTAVQQMQQARAAEYASRTQSPLQPGST